MATRGDHAFPNQIRLPWSQGTGPAVQHHTRCQHRYKGAVVGLLASAFDCPSNRAAEYMLTLLPLANGSSCTETPNIATKTGSVGRKGAVQGSSSSAALRVPRALRRHSRCGGMQDVQVNPPAEFLPRYNGCSDTSARAAAACQHRARAPTPPPRSPLSSTSHSRLSAPHDAAIRGKVSVQI